MVNTQLLRGMVNTQLRGMVNTHKTYLSTHRVMFTGFKDQEGPQDPWHV